MCALPVDLAALGTFPELVVMFKSVFLNSACDFFYWNGLDWGIALWAPGRCHVYFKADAESCGELGQFFLFCLSFNVECIDFSSDCMLVEGEISCEQNPVLFLGDC